MSGSNVKTWTAGELMQHVECEIAEAEQAIATLGATASKDALVAAVRAIRRRKAEALFDREEAARIAEAPEELDDEAGESPRP
ncbi:hypothetical protein FHT32_004792 [Variovorax sp. SG517]|uniref:hypothetical protein n=1 Tax=Variovorax sp. SG517 TaxID=2587117 RepID=UPI00159E7AF8|nr:hypothetical protein [Variovorax sp. SG517]NVM91128.1 hypothetical protein [Variovorax sp. SG517]